MKLVPDWRRVVAFGISFWCNIFGMLAMVLPEVRLWITGQDYDPVLAWSIGFGLLFAGTVGRLVRQGDSARWEWVKIVAVTIIGTLGVLLIVMFAQPAGATEPTAPTEAETLDVAVPFIAGWEGERLEAYIPIKGDVPTICFGSTRGITLGMKKTHEECVELLRVEVKEYRRGLHRYFTDLTKTQRLTPHRDAAYTSLAFNAGIRSIGRSTAVKRLNNGDIRGGCTAITWWNEAGGRVIRGLVRRRTAEYDLCMKGTGHEAMGLLENHMGGDRHRYVLDHGRSGFRTAFDAVSAMAAKVVDQSYASIIAAYRFTGSVWSAQGN